MGFGTIPVDANTELYLLISFCCLIAGCVAFVFLFLISRKRLGRIMPTGVLTFLLHNGVYETVTTFQKKDTLETRLGSMIFDSRGRTVYKPQGSGTMIAVVDKFSQSIENAHKFIQVLEAKNQGITEKFTFDTKDQALLYFYEQIYMKYSEHTPEWREEQAERLKSAKSKEDPKIYADLLTEIETLLPQEGGKIYAMTIDGNTIDANAMSQWLGTTSPENAPKDELQRGRESYLRKRLHDPGNIMLYIMAFIMLAVAGLIAYEVLR